MNFIKNLFKKTATKITAAILLLVLILSVFIFWKWYEKQINKVRGYYYVYQGDKAYKKGKFQNAVNNYNTGLKLYPEHAKARCNLGSIYVMYEDYYSATESYEEALLHKPEFIRCRINLGIIQSEKLSNHDTAIQQYDRAIRTKPKILQIPFIYNNWKSTKENRAIASYNKGLAYRGKSIYVGEKTFVSKQYLKKAKDAYKYTLKILKKSYDAHYNLALTNHLLGNYREAGIEYCKAINIHPNNFEAHYNLAILLKGLGHYKEALIEFEKAGMLLDARGDVVKTALVYETMNEVNQRLATEGEYEFLRQRSDGYNSGNGKVIMKHGLIVVDRHDDGKLHRYLKDCPSRHLFKDFETHEE